jgi:hypothetical protein
MTTAVRARGEGSIDRTRSSRADGPRSLSALALVLLLVACSESHSVETDVGLADAGATDDAWSEPDSGYVGCPDLTALLAFYDDLDRATCQRAIDCFNDASWLDARFLAGGCGPRVERVGLLCDAMRDGSLRFDATAAADCRAALVTWAATECFERFTGLFDYGWEDRTPPAICEDVALFGGERRPDGTPSDCTHDGCPFPMQCIAGSTCGGTCRFGQEGEACDWLLECAPGLSCDDSFTCSSACRRSESCLAGSHCIAGACVVSEAPGDGEPCLQADDGPVCAPGTFCDSPTSTCRTLAPLGGACTYEYGDHGCAYGWCTGHICEMPNACGPNTGPPFGCLPDLYCGEDGACTSDTTAVQCEDLAHVTGRESCPTGYWCVRQFDYGALCRREVPLGAACDREVVCPLGATCSGDRCVPVVGLGEACGTDSGAVCFWRYECSREGRCEEWRSPYPDRGLGDTCAGDYECFEGTCRDGRCVWAGAGEPCRQSSACPNFDCASGVCSPYVCVGEGEPCDDEHLCDEPQRCLLTGDFDAAHQPIRICRAPCTR